MTSVPLLELEADDLEPASISNPFPGSDTRVWTGRFSEALALETDLSKSETDPIAAYVSRPKDHLTRQGGIYRLKPSALRTDGGLTILTVTAHGFTGSPGEYNERIRGAFDSPLRPDARPELVLPTLTTGRTSDELAPFLTTLDPVDNDRQARLLTQTDAALDTADGDRGYRLVEDLAVYGQKTETLHALLVRRIRERAEGGFRVRLVPDLMAIKGANRSRARLNLHSLTAKEIVFGFSPYAKMGISRVDDPISADPTYWVPIFADLLKAAFDDPDHPGHKIARRAAKVATVQLQIVVGASAHTLDGFHNSVFDPNRVDHRRPPLDYKLADKAASDLRALLREAALRSQLTEPQRAWLAGEGPDPQPEHGETLVDARDRRDSMLFNFLFPETKNDRALIRNVIGEPPPSQTGRRHVDNRTRMLSAVISDGYDHRWNPRVLDGLLPTSTIKEGFTFPFGENWFSLLQKAAQGAEQALEAFILTRGMHWLAEHKIVEADRGSVGAQTQEADEADEVTRRIRRTMISAQDALKLKPIRTVGLMRELARAANTRTAPRQVDIDGNPIEGTTASRAWFDEAFPKTAKKKRNQPPPGPSDNPEQPDPTPQELLTEARVAFQGALASSLPEAFKSAFIAGSNLQKAAENADTVAFPENLTDTVIPLLGEALTAARTDAKSLMAILNDLQHGGVDAADFESQCAEFLGREAEQ